MCVEFDLPDIEAIAKQAGERPAGERDAAHGLSCFKATNLGDDIALAQVGHEQVEAAELEIGAEDRSDPLSLSLIEGDLSALCVAAERRHAADPEPPPLKGDSRISTS
jgi:hypothetical protein